MIFRVGLIVRDRGYGDMICRVGLIVRDRDERGWGY